MLMRSEPPKFTAASDLLADAAALAQAKIGVAYGPAGAKVPRFLTRTLPARFIHVLALIRVHFKLVPRIRDLAGSDLIVIPEFVSIPMLMVAARTWSVRRKLLCIINHNVQRAHARRLDRWALLLMAAVGIRFACYESAAGFAELGLMTDAAHLLVLPLPVYPRSPPRDRRATRGKRVVGVIGRYRAEKGFDALIERLVGARRSGSLDAEIVLGFPEEAARARWARTGIVVLDTTTPEDYWRALGSCDVVVLNYTKADYFYRSSNVITDAASQRTAVVCPNFPVLRRQVSSPAAVGATFDALSDLVPAILQALRIVENEPSNFDAYIAARQLPALAHLLDAFVFGRSQDAAT